MIRRLAPLLAALVLLAGAATSARAQGRANPHRELQGRPCTACHGTGGWRDVRFDHRQTRFPLRGQHLAAPCTGCHDLRDFRAAVRQCGTCHQDPHRGDAGTTCEQCHNESGWRIINANEAHANTRLPDLGVHAALRCEDCHAQTGVQPFHGRVTQCVTCHRPDYDATTNPSHATLGIPTNCDQCHQMATWQFALFPQHDASFPIYTGAHAGVWSSCATCHPNSSDYKVFTCTVCHTQAPTDQHHAGIPGYSWDSQACLNCHPNGSGGDLSFHEGIFPIYSAPHGGTWTDCAQCHVDPASRANVSCLTGGCHAQAATDPPHQGIPGYAYTTPQCRSCHPDGRIGNFAQHDALFPIYTGSHRGRWSLCTQCHTDPSSRTVYTCMGGNCHPKATTDSHHRGEQGYSYVATECLRCHPNGRSD
jgi:hypothetical protein